MLFALWLLAAPSVYAQPQLVCDQLRLMDASGIVSTEHRYTFTAHCYRHASETKGTTTTNVVWIDFDVIARAVGNGKPARPARRSTSVGARPVSVSQQACVPRIPG